MELPKEEDESLLSNLIESNSLGPAIKAVYDRGWHDSYEAYLTKTVEGKHAQIKAICNDNYEEFIDSMDSLSTAKSEIQQLKESVRDLNEHVQTSGHALVEEATSLMSLRKQRYNLTNTITILRNFEFVLSLTTKVQQQIQAKKFFLALKTLDQLERQYLPQFKGYHFARYLEASIPGLLQQVKDSVTYDFEAWLVSIQQKFKALGKLAMEQTSAYLLEKKKAAQRVEAGSDEQSAAVPDSTWDDGTEGLLERVGIVLVPVLQCTLIFHHLSMADQLQILYRERRGTQLERALELPANQSLTDFLQCLCGFFIVEDSVSKAGNRLVHRTQIEKMWDEAMQKVGAALSQRFQQVKDPSAFLKLHKRVLTFSSTMQSFGLDRSALLDLLATQRHILDKLFSATLVVHIKEMLAREKVEPLSIDTREEYKAKVLAFELRDPHQHIDFPATMPFSSSVPVVCRTLQALAGEYAKYVKHMPQLEEHVWTAMDAAVVVVDGLLAVSLTKPSLNLSQVSLLSINTAHLEACCAWLENYIAMKLVKTGSSRRLLKQGRAALMATNVKCEHLLHEMFRKKIDQFFTLDTSIWLPSAPRTEPSDYIEDLLVYLETALMTVHSMSEPVREAAYFTSCGHVNRTLLDALFNAKKFNILAIYNLNIDLKALETFTTRCQIPGLGEVFAELRQLVDLFLAGNLTNYVSLQAQYPLVSANKLLVLLTRFKDLSMFRSTKKDLPPQLLQIRKKDVDLLVRALKQQLRHR